MALNFIKLLKSIVATPDQQISLLDIVAEKEYDTIINIWNQTKYPIIPLCLHQLFEKQATQIPKHPALIFGEQIISYEELNKQSNRLARYLRTFNVSSDEIVGIGFERSIELVTSIYSIMKAGGAYLPLELSYPKDRLNYMLEDANVKVVITIEAHLDKFLDFKGKIILLDKIDFNESEDNLDIGYSLSNLAYVIYTSGSTGHPKGVCIEHEGLVNRVSWMQREYTLSPKDRILQKTPYSFDVSVWEFFWPLAFGATLTIAKPGIHRDTVELIKTIQDYSITCLHFVPSMLSSFLELQGGNKCPTLRMVFASGEALSPNLVKQFFEQTAAQLHNLYGPTEASIDVTHWNCCNTSSDMSIPIGKPISNIETFILDAMLIPVPIGVPGELYLCGVGLARCYLNKPILTTDRFLPLPFLLNKRAYKTGDLVRYLPGGDIEFLGRLDHQVKIRGYRIELGEIENVLANHPEVLQCVIDVVVGTTGNKFLVAYIVVKNPIENYFLHDYLSEKIPEYMIPTQFITMNQFPLTTSGKVDRKALFQNKPLSYRNPHSIVLPRNEKESNLVQIWKNVLRLETVSITDNFFELGGDSILSIQIIAYAKKLGYRLQLADLFSFPTIEKIGLKIKTFDTNEKVINYTPFSLVNPQYKEQLVYANLEDAYPLASLQAGMIYHSELNPQVAVYQDTFSYEFEGELRQDFLLSILESEISIHPALRTSFNFDDYSTPLQLVHNKGILQIEFKDISSFADNRQNQIIEEWFKEETEKRLTLSIPSLIRFSVHKRSDKAFHFGFTFHHAILDGWSVATLITNIIQHYESKADGKLFSPHQPHLSYGAYVNHEQEFANSQEQYNFWKTKLQDFHQLKIYDHLNVNKGLSEEDFSYNRPLDRNLVKKLHELAKQLNVPLKSVLLAAYVRVLSRISGDCDITTGYILNGRLEEFDSENTLGLFLNTVPFRILLNGGTWEDLVLLVYEEEKDLLSHRWYPLAQIQNQHQGSEIFNTSFNYAHFHVYDSLKMNKHIRLVNHKVYEKTNFLFSANFYVDTIQGDLYLSLERDQNKISAQKIEEIFVYFENALGNLAYNSKSNYQLDSLLSEKELNKLFNTWNNTEIDLDNHTSILDLFEKQVQEKPDHIAVIFEKKEITYQELNRQANQIAFFLKKQKDVSIIALSIERSIDLIIGFMGILKSGKGVLPLASNTPIDRLRYIFKNSNTQILLTDSHFQSKNEGYGCKIYEIEKILKDTPRVDKIQTSLHTSDLAYILYTSGSTGVPKGVEVEHGALKNQIQWLQHTFQLNDQDKVLHHSSLAFDVSIEEILWPLCSGASVVIGPEGIHQNLEGLIDLIDLGKVTILDLVPSLLEVILQHPHLDRLKSLRQVLVGGEVLHNSIVKKFYENLSARLHNMYGLTETTITSTHYPCQIEHGFDDCSVGHPIWNTKTYILDMHLCPLPIGVPGEICISGKGIARGYLDQEELTKQKFILNPFTKNDGTYLFRTGDLGYYYSDGSIRFLGRGDNQIKIRGQRIELGEIENSLRKHHHISNAIVELQADANGNKQLIAFVVLEAQSSCNEVEIKQWLCQWIPYSWMPSFFMILSQLPILPSGKIDRKALPGIEFGVVNHKRILPNTMVENMLAQIWCEILLLKEVGINENFFTLGGNSLSITVAAIQIRKKFGKNIPLRIFLENPTITNLARMLDEQLSEVTFQDFALEEVSLPSDIIPKPGQQISLTPSNILLTGATGFLGAHLLLDLYESSTATIYCLVRADDLEKAKTRLIKSFSQYFPGKIFPKERIIALLGDLSLPNLGFDEDAYQNLTQSLDMIYHCGALVHHVYDYKTLFAPNVLSVIEILKIATTGKLKKMIYISTLSVAESGQTEIQENFLKGKSNSSLSGGYEQTKWVSEKILAEAFDRGIPVQIFRPNTIIGHSLTGICSYENDHLMRLIKGCIQMEKAPDWDLKLDLLPVDFISKVIIEISLKENKSSIFNLSNDKQIDWLDLIIWLNDFGYNIATVPYKQWKESLSTVDSDNALYPLLSLYLEDENIEKVVDKKVSISNTLSALSKMDLSMPTVDQRSLHTMLDYLSKDFLPTKAGVFL